MRVRGYMGTLHSSLNKNKNSPEKIKKIYNIYYPMATKGRKYRKGRGDSVQSCPTSSWDGLEKGARLRVCCSSESTAVLPRAGTPNGGSCCWQKDLCGRGGKTSRLLTCKCIFHYCALKSEFVIFHYFSRHPFSQNYLSFSPQKS